MFQIPDNTPSPPRYLTYEQMNLINQFRHVSFDLAMWAYAYTNALKDKSNRADALYAKLLDVPSEYSQLFFI